jgi:hypothetical protein
MSKSRRLRQLAPDQALYDRCVAGESLHSLAPDYGVVHSTLSRHFRKPEAVLELREARRRLQAERRARRAEERSLEQEVRSRAREDAEHDRQLEAWKRHRPRRSGYAGWLDAHDAPRGLHSRARYSESDHVAETVVAAGGGVEQIIDATPLRGRENILRNIDAQIMRRGVENDSKFPANARPDDSGLRKFQPDSELIRRRAGGEAFRSLAADYGVSHTTLSRYFRRAAVAKQLRGQRRAQGRYRRPARTGDHS